MQILRHLIDESLGIPLNVLGMIGNVIRQIEERRKIPIYMCVFVHK